MKIFCYGDSNTWGDSGAGSRYDLGSIWPNILQEKLSEDHLIYFDGLCGRTATSIDTKKDYYDGKLGYKIALRREVEPDLIVIALGINDLKPRYSLSPNQILESLIWYREYTNEYFGSNKKVVFVFYESMSPNKYFNFNTNYFKELKQMILDEFEHSVILQNVEYAQDELHFSENDHQEVAKQIQTKIEEVL